MKKIKRKKIFFWTTVIVWIISTWIIITSQTLDFLKNIFGDNQFTIFIVNNSQLFAWVLGILIYGYILWAVIEKGRFPPY